MVWEVVMGIDRLTALSIANNAEVMEVITYGPYAGDEPPNVVGKFGAAICWKEHPHPRYAFVECGLCA